MTVSPSRKHMWRRRQHPALTATGAFIAVALAALLLDAILHPANRPLLQLIHLALPLALALLYLRLRKTFAAAGAEALDVALAGAPVVLFRQDRSLRYTWVYNHPFGEDPAEVERALRDAFSPEDAALLDAVKRRVLEVGEAQVARVEMTVRGETRTYDISVSPLWELDGSVGGLGCTALDVTGETRAREVVGRLCSGVRTVLDRRSAELRETVQRLEREAAEKRQAREDLEASEDRFRQLFAQTDEAIVLFHPQKERIIDANPAVEELFGFSRQELQAQGAVFFPAGSAEIFRAAMNDIGRSGAFRLDNIDGVRSDGSPLNLSVRGKIIRIREVALVYCTLRNITDRIRAEEAARLVQAKLIHANKMTALGVLVAGIAHEVNNPNNFIMANAEVLGRMLADALPVLEEFHRENGDFVLGGLPYAEARKVLPELPESICDGSRRIRDIIDTMKTFAREEKSAPARPVDVNSVVSLAVSLLGHQIRRKTQNFSLQAGEALPPVAGSPQQLEQVVINLLSNALEALASADRGVRVATAAAGDVVAITVADEGEGIPPELGERIFDPFFTTRIDSGGTGLGLCISHAIVREHGGTLTFEAQQGEGTVFTVTLPAMKGDGA